jgi:Ca2+:H+ antiporter
LQFLGLAEAINPALEAVIKAAEAPKTLVGTTTSILVLIPEGYTAAWAAKAKSLQKQS